MPSKSVIIFVLGPPLRFLAWEKTCRGNLARLLCRAAAGSGPYPGALTTEEGIKLLDDLNST